MVNDVHDMTGRDALVTGAGGGIGRATALAFARRGAQVAALDVDADLAARTVAEVKHGVVGLTKAAAVDYATEGIRVNAVLPGPVATPFTDDLPQEIKDQLLSLTPIRRFAGPEEVAEAVVWLCSDAASYLVGAALAVDCGVVAY